VARFKGEDGAEAQTIFFHELWKDITWPEPGLKYRVVSDKGKGGDKGKK
jgi:hypothetical protein